MRPNGTIYDFDLWEIGRCTEYDVEVENQMRKTIVPLQDKIHLLNQIREENDVNFILEIVPSIYAGDTNPCLVPPLDVIDFCHATRTVIFQERVVIEFKQIDIALQKNIMEYETY